MSNELDLAKVSATTRKLVASASLSHQAMIADLSHRHKRGDHVELIVQDIMVARISLALKHQDDLGKAAKACKDRVEFEAAALLIIGKKNLGGQGDDVRNKSEQDMFDASKKWVNRARRDAGFPSEDKRGAAGRKASQAKAPDTAPIVAAPVTSDAPKAFEVPKLVIPKPKASADVIQIVDFLASAANKALAEGSDGALDGDVGMLARDALIAFVAAGRKFTEARDALKLKADKDAGVKGASRASVAALKAKFDKAPVSELAN